MSSKLSDIVLLKDTLLPFLLIIDENGKIINVGNGLHKIANRNIENLHVDDCVQFIYPNSFPNLKKLKSNSLIKFSLLGTKVVLKGDFHFYEKEKLFLLLNTPVFNSLSTIKDANLSLNDFAENSNMAEYLFLTESNRRSLNEAFQLVESVKQKNNNLSILNRFVRIIQECNTLDEVVWSLAKNAVAELGFYDCVIYLFDEKREYLVQRAAHGNKNPSKKQILNAIKIKYGEGIVGSVAKSGEAEIINDTSKDERYIYDDEVRLSEITVPIFYNNKVIGILDSEHPEKNFFTKKNLEFLKTVSSLAATKLIQIDAKNQLLKNKEDLEVTVINRTKELELAFLDLEQKNKEIEIQNLELGKLSLFPKHNPNPVIELDFYFNVIYFNEAAKKTFELLTLKNEYNLYANKIKILLRLTIKGKSTGKFKIKEGFVFKEKNYDLNIYIDNENKFIRLYLNDITENIQLQNSLEEKRDSILDSLNYSLRIQQSILPDLNQLKDTFDDYFLSYKPKDIVSGDFYWTEKVDDRVLFSLNDCTGHGVPGALMSIIGHDALNSIFSSFKRALNVEYLCVGDILNELNKYYFNLRKKSMTDFRDTMDVMVVCFDRKEMSLLYSGSKQRLYIIRDNDLQIYNTDSYTLGFLEDATFTSGKIDLVKGDLIYLFTDGYVDQFGGERGKKFKYSRFRELLLSVSKFELAKQKEVIEQTMNNWMNAENYQHEQIDDISIIGFKV